MARTSIAQTSLTSSQIDGKPEYSGYMAKSVEISKDDIRGLTKFLEEELENAGN